jgi:hypothetical protein
VDVRSLPTAIEAAAGEGQVAAAARVAAAGAAAGEAAVTWRELEQERAARTAARLTASATSDVPPSWMRPYATQASNPGLVL